MGLSLLQATHTRPRRADKVKGAAGMRYNAPAGLMSADMRMKPGMKVRMLMTRSERAEPSSDFLSWLSMILLVLVLARVVIVCSVKLIFDVDHHEASGPRVSPERFC
jgi:hypothetical protein